MTAAEHLEAARVAFAGNRFADALREFEAMLALEPKSCRAQAGIARCLAHLGRADDALDAARRAVKLGPGEPWGHLALAQLWYRAQRAGELVKAIRAADGVTFPRDLDATLHAMLAYGFAQLHRHAEAAAAAARAIELAPGSSFSHYAQAIAFDKQHRMVDAIAAIDRALALEPDEVYHHERDRMAAQLTALAGRIVTERAAAEAEPTAKNWQLVGELHDLHGDYADSLDALDRSLALAPKQRAVWLRRAEVLQRAGRGSEIADTLARAEKLRVVKTTVKKKPPASVKPKPKAKPAPAKKPKASLKPKRR